MKTNSSPKTAETREDHIFKMLQAKSKVMAAIRTSEYVPFMVAFFPEKYDNDEGRVNLRRVWNLRVTHKGDEVIISDFERLPSLIKAE
jgi:hypothetical protein